MKGKDFFIKLKKKVTTAYIAKIALLSAISFVMYMYVKFKLPFMFPSFLEMQFSELPAILAGFSLGPVAGGLVIVIKCLIKFPLTTTAFVGEITDMILGVLYVVPASIVYQIKKTKKNAIIGFLIGTATATVAAILLNRFVSVPFYVKAYFGGNFELIVNMCSTIYKGATIDTFYYYYLFLGILPFNILRLALVSAVTFLVYKRLSKALHWEIKRRKDKKEDTVDNSSDETIKSEQGEEIIEKTVDKTE